MQQDLQTSSTISAFLVCVSCYAEWFKCFTLRVRFSWKQHWSERLRSGCGRRVRFQRASVDIHITYNTDSSWCWYKHPVYETLWSNWLTKILEVFPQNLTWTYLKQAGFFFLLLQKIQINTTENKVKYRPNTLCRFNIKRKSQFDSPAKSVQVHQSPVLLAWAHVSAPRKTKPSLYFTSGLIHNLKPDVITSCGYRSSDTSTLFFLLGAVCWETCMCCTESANVWILVSGPFCINGCGKTVLNAPLQPESQ